MKTIRRLRQEWFFRWNVRFRQWCRAYRIRKLKLLYLFFQLRFFLRMSRLQIRHLFRMGIFHLDCLLLKIFNPFGKHEDAPPCSEQQNDEPGDKGADHVGTGGSLGETHDDVDQ